TYDLDGGNDNRATVKLETNTNRTDVDFGYKPIPSLSFTKTVDKAYVKRGETVIYSLTVLNDGKTDLENIRISDAAVGIDITIPKLASNASITTSVAFIIPA